MKVEERLKTYPEAFEVAVLGCAVNGPGEAGDADFGIAGGRDVGFVYAHGRVLKKVSSDILVEELFHEIDRWIALAEEFDVPLLVDSAAGFGSEYSPGRPLGGAGLAEVFSFHATKPFAIGFLVSRSS